MNGKDGFLVVSLKDELKQTCSFFFLIENSGVEQKTCKGETMVEASNGGKKKKKKPMIQVVMLSCFPRRCTGKSLEFEKVSSSSLACHTTSILKKKKLSYCLKAKLGFFFFNSICCV